MRVLQITTALAVMAIAAHSQTVSSQPGGVPLLQQPVQATLPPVALQTPAMQQAQLQAVPQQPVMPYQQVVPAAQQQQQAASQQAPAAPPPPVMPSAARPANAAVLFEYHCVGVQNYTTLNGNDYANTGTVGDLYQVQNTQLQKVGWHFVDTRGYPTWQVWDLQRGNMDGAVSGQKVGNSDVPNAQNDGGFGSIPQALFQTIPGTASGVFGSVAYIQRINTLGGRIPGNFYSIPAFQTIKNYALAIPFQADYVFLSAGGAAAPAQAVGTSG
ncbi:hypothetical protein WJX81_005101 [Elliptochloris bilobata]|uniref:Uncharacterized protein n=1 Tax=Elliptochloris bilobata TaxID=381761 RepID=A0AAW1RQJ2_9CHLO